MNSSLSAQSQSFRRTGNHWIWFTGSALILCIAMILTVIGIILVNGAGFFWPKEAIQYQMKDGKKYLAILRQKEKIPPAQAREQNLEANPHRQMIMVANRDTFQRVGMSCVNDVLQAVLNDHLQARAQLPALGQAPHPTERVRTSG